MGQNCGNCCNKESEVAKLELKAEDNYARPQAQDSFSQETPFNMILEKKEKPVGIKHSKAKGQQPTQNNIQNNQVKYDGTRAQSKELKFTSHNIYFATNARTVDQLKRDKLKEIIDQQDVVILVQKERMQIQEKEMERFAYKDQDSEIAYLANQLQFYKQEVQNDSQNIQIIHKGNSYVDVKDGDGDCRKHDHTNKEGSTNLNKKIMQFETQLKVRDVNQYSALKSQKSLKSQVSVSKELEEGGWQLLVDPTSIHDNDVRSSVNPCSIQNTQGLVNSTRKSQVEGSIDDTNFVSFMPTKSPIQKGQDRYNNSELQKVQYQDQLQQPYPYLQNKEGKNLRMSDVQESGQFVENNYQNNNSLFIEAQFDVDKLIDKIESSDHKKK